MGILARASQRATTGRFGQTRPPDQAGIAEIEKDSYRPIMVSLRHFLQPSGPENRGIQRRNLTAHFSNVPTKSTFWQGKFTRV